ncbi:hypothetical protein [Dinghuibacter silviterrae]|nr:hypothetical protein [Dinghuibacter silviterrae]
MQHLKRMGADYPALYAENHLDSLESFLKGEDDHYVFIFALQKLAEIEAGNFAADRLPCNVRRRLCRLSYYFRGLQKGTFAFNIDAGKREPSDMTRYVKPLFLLSARWANDLLARRNGLDSTEVFMLRVFSGDILRPRQFLKGDKALDSVIHAVELHCLSSMRRYPSGHGRYALEGGSGAWIPIGPLSVVGTHPSLDCHFGGGRATYEIAIDFGFRFFSTPRPYQVFRDDSLWSCTDFFGGHIGATYTRYVFRHPHWELGLVTGIAYEGFDITENDTGIYKRLDPADINSADWMNGLRFNWFSLGRSHIGLEAVYHLIHYDNPKGTDLSGDAFTVRVLIGGN